MKNFILKYGGPLGFFTILIGIIFIAFEKVEIIGHFLFLLGATFALVYNIYLNKKTGKGKFYLIFWPPVILLILIRIFIELFIL